MRRDAREDRVRQEERTSVDFEFAERARDTAQIVVRRNIMTIRRCNLYVHVVELFYSIPLFPQSLLEICDHLAEWNFSAVLFRQDSWINRCFQFIQALVYLNGSIAQRLFEDERSMKEKCKIAHTNVRTKIRFFNLSFRREMPNSMTLIA